MNEQIRELAIKVNPSSKQIYDVVESWPYNCAAWSGEDLQKFAELIIRETLQVARAGMEYGPSMEEAVYTYFGVE